MSKVVKNFYHFVNENQLNPEELEELDNLDALADAGVIEKPKEIYSIVDRRGQIEIGDLSDTFVNFAYELKQMMDLYKDQRYTRAEQLRDKLAEQLDDLMRSS